jgi:hypothetical protein
MFKNLFICLILGSLAACSRPWTEKDKAEFVAGCMSRAVADHGIDTAKTYCHCLLDKVVRKYHNARDAAYIRYDTTLNSMAKECLKQP